ncbi:hypothetical protein [Mucilaginibacter sp. KACC 22063]|uniref:hypothetical protein n=1 Tax=Mucilaginibacter sp. KACC 22063 TaxID=3025666 RepID=UPI0023653570|nr:hypothetical protein [Mucilaginibacter sp. KACC 22063]WDF53958.1 hypothetical protein PQ461_13500 [Mucilaginibacter sp. KACC 22063]
MNIPETYQDWHYCITVQCGIKLDRLYIEQRINALQDENDDYTKSFVHRYGEQHLQQVLKWFYLAQQEAL